jgi:hypothetical protein
VATTDIFTAHRKSRSSWAAWKPGTLDEVLSLLALAVHPVDFARLLREDRRIEAARPSAPVLPLRRVAR